MSHSIASILCAGMLLAVGARAVEPSASASASASAPPAAAPAPHAKAAAASAANHTVKIFVTLRDEKGNPDAKANVRIEPENSQYDIGVDPGGVKVSVPGNHSAVVKVLFPGGHCDVTLTPTQIASRLVAIGVERGADEQKCLIEGVAQAGKPASAPAGRSSASDTTRHATSLLTRLF